MELQATNVAWHKIRWLNTSPWLKKIHNDKRYDAMLAKVKLPKL
jgi:hypothetical protein